MIRVIRAEIARVKSENARITEEKLAEDRLKAEECEQAEFETLERKIAKNEELKKVREEVLQMEKELLSLKECSPLEASLQRQ